MYVIITNIDTLNAHDLSFSDFDELSQDEKLGIEHLAFSVPELIQSLNDCDFQETYNPEYNIYTLIEDD